MNFDNYIVPVSIEDGYRYDLRKTGRMVGTALLDDGRLWIATPYEQIRDCHVKPVPEKAMTFKRLEAAEYYLLALVMDGDGIY
jgi:hypothetical protein